MSTETPARLLEWSEPDGQHVIRGWLRGHPEITLFLIQTSENRPDRGTLSGAPIPDAIEQDDQLDLVDWLKLSATIYLREFREMLNQAHEDEMQGIARRLLRQTSAGEPPAQTPPPSR